MLFKKFLMLFCFSAYHGKATGLSLGIYEELLGFINRPTVSPRMYEDCNVNQRKFTPNDIRPKCPLTINNFCEASRLMCNKIEKSEALESFEDKKNSLIRKFNEMMNNEAIKRSCCSNISKEGSKINRCLQALSQTKLYPSQFKFPVLGPSRPDLKIISFRNERILYHRTKSRTVA